MIDEIIHFMSEMLRSTQITAGVIHFMSEKLRGTQMTTGVIHFMSKLLMDTGISHSLFLPPCGFYMLTIFTTICCNNILFSNNNKKLYNFSTTVISVIIVIIGHKINHNVGVAFCGSARVILTVITIGGNDKEGFKDIALKHIKVNYLVLCYGPNCP